MKFKSLLITTIFFLASFSLAQAFTPKTDGLYAEIKTNKGSIHLRLFYDKAPNTVLNFIQLAKGEKEWKHPLTQKKMMGTPLYKNITFHRVIPNFMIQTGDPFSAQRGHASAGRGGPGFRFADEFHPSLKHNKPGILSMANAGPNTNGSQIFITHVPTPWLDKRHSIFGEVVEGMKVVNSIKQWDQFIEVVITAKGKEAMTFNQRKK